MSGTAGVRKKSYWVKGHAELRKRIRAHITGCVQLYWEGLQSMLDKAVQESLIRKKDLCVTWKDGYIKKIDLRDTWEVFIDPLLECIPTVPIIGVDLWRVVVTQHYLSPASPHEVQKSLRYSNTTNYPCSKVVGEKTVAESAGRKSISYVSKQNMKHPRHGLSTSYLQNHQRKFSNGVKPKIYNRVNDKKFLPKSSADKSLPKSSSNPNPAVPKLTEAVESAQTSKRIVALHTTQPKNPSVPKQKVKPAQTSKEIVALNTSQPKNEPKPKITLDDAITLMKNNPDQAQELIMPKLTRRMNKLKQHFTNCPEILWEGVLSKLCPKNKGQLMYQSPRKQAYIEFLRLFSILTPYHFNNPNTIVKLSICPLSTKLLPEIDNQIAGGLKFKGFCEVCQLTNWMTPYEMLFHVFTKHGVVDGGLFGEFFHTCVSEATSNPVPLYDHQILTIMKNCAFGWRLKTDVKLGDPVLLVNNTCASDTFLFCVVVMFLLGCFSPNGVKKEYNLMFECIRLVLQKESNLARILHFYNIEDMLPHKELLSDESSNEYELNAHSSFITTFWNNPHFQYKSSITTVCGSCNTTLKKKTRICRTLVLTENGLKDVKQSIKDVLTKGYETKGRCDICCGVGTVEKHDVLSESLPTYLHVEKSPLQESFGAIRRIDDISPVIVFGGVEYYLRCVINSDGKHFNCFVRLKEGTLFYDGIGPSPLNGGYEFRPELEYFPNGSELKEPKNRPVGSLLYSREKLANNESPVHRLNHLEKLQCEDALIPGISEIKEKSRVLYKTSQEESHSEHTCDESDVEVVSSLVGRKPKKTNKSGNGTDVSREDDSPEPTDSMMMVNKDDNHQDHDEDEDSRFSINGDAPADPSCDRDQATHNYDESSKQLSIFGDPSVATKDVMPSCSPDETSDTIINMEIEVVGDSSMKQAVGYEEGSVKECGYSREDVDMACEENGSGSNDNADDVDDNEGNRSEKNLNNTSGSGDNNDHAGANDDIPDEVRENEDNRRDKNDDNDDEKSKKNDSIATVDSNAKTQRLLEHFKVLIKSKQPDIDHGANVNREEFEEYYSLPIVNETFFFFLQPCVIASLMSSVVLWDVAVINTMIHFLLVLINLQKEIYIHPHVILLPPTNDPTTNQWTFSEEHLSNITNENVTEKVNESDVAFIFVISKCKGGDDPIPDHIGLLEVNNKPQVYVSYDKKTRSKKKDKKKTTHCGRTMTFYDPYEAFGGLANTLLRTFGGYLCSEGQGAFFNNENKNGISKENQMILRRVGLQDGVPSDNSCASMSFDRLLESLKRYNVEIPKNLGEGSELYTDVSADCKTKMTLRLIQFIHNANRDGVNVPMDCVNSHTYDHRRAAIVEDSPSKFSKVALSALFTQRIVDNPMLLTEYAHSRCPCGRQLFTSDSRVTCTNCSKEYHTPCFLELFKCFKDHENIVCCHCNHPMSEDKPPVFQSPNIFGRKSGEIVTEVFNGAIALNFPKQSASRVVMMSNLQKETNNFLCSYSGISHTDIADLSMLCFLHKPYFEQHLDEQSIQKLLEYSDEDLGAVIQEYKPFFNKFGLGKKTNETCVQQMSQLRSLIEPYKPADIDKRLDADVNNIKDQSIWILLVAFAGKGNSLDFEKCINGEEEIYDAELMQSFMKMNKHVKYDRKIFREILVEDQVEEEVQLQLFRVLWDFLHTIPGERGREIFEDIRKWDSYQRLSDCVSKFNSEIMDNADSDNVKEVNDHDDHNPTPENARTNLEETWAAGSTEERKRTANDVTGENDNRNENSQKKKPRIEEKLVGDDGNEEPKSKKARRESTDNQESQTSQIAYLEMQLREAQAEVKKHKLLAQKATEEMEKYKKELQQKESHSLEVKVIEHKSCLSQRKIGIKMNKRERELSGEDIATYKCYCCASERASSWNASMNFVKQGNFGADISPTLLPMHCKDTRAKIKKHTDLLPEVLEYLSIVSFKQTEFGEAEIEHVSGLLLLVSIMYPSLNRHTKSADGRFELLRHLHKSFHDAEANTLDRVIGYFSSWKNYFESQFDGHEEWWDFKSPQTRLQAFFGTDRSAKANEEQKIEVKAFFHFVYKPVEGQEYEAYELLKTSLNNKFTGKMLECSGLWVKRYKSHKHNKMTPFIIKATKILSTIEEIINERIEDLGKEEDKFFAEDQLFDLQRKLAAGITQTITEDIKINDLRTKVTNLIETTVARFSWVIQQRLFSLRHIAKNAKYTCFGGCRKAISDLNQDQWTSWELLGKQKRLTNVMREKKRSLEDALDFGDMICNECLMGNPS